MPEKPKRRKNNKNKRKNKNNNWQHANKNNSGASEVSKSEECSVSGSQTDIEGSAADLSTTGVSQKCDGIINSNDVKKSASPKKETLNLCDSSTSNSQQVMRDQRIHLVNANANLLHKHTGNEETISDLPDYVVETPEQSANCIPKFCKVIKSKSLDNDDVPKIVEITDNHSSDSPSLVESNVHVSEVESDIEWETAKSLPKMHDSPNEIGIGKLSVTSIPLTVAQCDHNKSLSPEEEQNLRQYLDTLNLTTQPPEAGIIEIKVNSDEVISHELKQRFRKMGYVDDLAAPRPGPTRLLDVIDEESGESSLASRRQSYLSEKKSDNDDFDDEVFEEKKQSCKRMEKCPPAIKIWNKNLGCKIPQQCILVDAKIKEPEAMEACGSWSVQSVEKMSGAEVVYLTDSSSSTGSLYDLNDDTDQSVETDVSVRMITPTIEVTDAERLLKESFICNGETNSLHKNDRGSSNENTDPSPHEIEVLSTDDINTSLYVKDLDDNSVLTENDEANDISLQNNQPKCKQQKNRDLDLEMKVLKCETNVAFNNLLYEYVSDTESSETRKEKFNRQDSTSSVGSSQCTAKYNPTTSSLNDVSNILHDEITGTSRKLSELSHLSPVLSHVKDVIKCVAGAQLDNERNRAVFKQPHFLRDLCLKKIAALPFGEKILEELALVSEHLQNINIYGCIEHQSHVENPTKSSAEPEKMPYYPLPDVSGIGKVSLQTKPKESAPPPIQPRNSSLKISQEDSHWTGLPTQQEPLYVCLSPSQKMLMEKTNTVISKEDASQLVDMHIKYVNRRGYNEQDNLGVPYDKKSLGDPSAIPFKSQTGSRLLALIRDPAVTDNIHSSQRKSYYNSSVDQLPNIYESSKPKKHELFNSAKDFTQSFKPIPPPRPKKISSHLYESDESSDFTDNSLRSIKSERKVFHYSTGNLSKEIENDVSSIQNMHGRFVNVRESIEKLNCPRRPSLPKDLCEQQMEYIRQKEKEVEAEILRLENQKRNVTKPERMGPRAPLISEKEVANEQYFESIIKPHVTLKRDVFSRTKSPDRGEKAKTTSMFNSSLEELTRDKMYSEYMSQIAERQERKQKKIIKITNTSADHPNMTAISKSMTALDILESKTNNPIEKEFICKARERWNKLGITDPETEDERDVKRNVYHEPTTNVVEHRIKVIECGQERDVWKLPGHLQEFVRLTAKDKEKGTSSPGESSAGPMTPHVILCAILILVIAVVKHWMRLLRNK